MKYTILLLITLSIALGGCSDEWLNDVEPQGKLLEVNYYQSQDEMEKGLISIYNVFKNQYWQGVWSCDAGLADESDSPTRQALLFRNSVGIVFAQLCGVF